MLVPAFRLNGLSDLFWSEVLSSSDSEFSEFQFSGSGLQMRLRHCLYRLRWVFRGSVLLFYLLIAKSL